MSRRFFENNAMWRAAIVYASIWAVVVVSYWILLAGGSGSWIFGYTLCLNYVLLPLAACVTCGYLGWRKVSGSLLWIALLVCTLAYVVAPMATYDLSTALGLANIAHGGPLLLLVGFIPAFLGLVCGRGIRALRDAMRQQGSS